MNLPVALLALACTLSPPSPVVDRVSPQWGWTGEATDVVIEGERFYPSIEADPAAEGGGRVDGTFLAWLETEPPTALAGVELVGYDALRAQVPAGLPIGAFDVRVRTPGGAEGVLEDGFVVTETRADHLDLEVATAAYTVGETARLVARLQDPSGEPVAQPLLVEIRAASATGATGAVFLDGGLDGQVPLADGVGVRGTLGEDGDATLLVRSDTPDDVTFTLSAAGGTDGGVVRPDALLLSWDPGAIDRIEVELPYEDFTATAGAPYSVQLTLRDALGNRLDDESIDVLVYESCGNWRQTVTVTGSAMVQPTSRVACADNAIYVFASGLSAESPSFGVTAGPVDAYSVTATPSVVTAGADDVVVLVEAVDAFGNRVDGHAADLALQDDLGGLDSTRGVGATRCPGFPLSGPAAQLCLVRLWTSGTTPVRVMDDDGHAGASAPVVVLAGDPVRLSVTTSDTRVAAGEAFEAAVAAQDAYGNRVELDPESVTLRDDTGTLACAPDGAVDGAPTYLCSVTAATADAGLEAEVDGLVATTVGPLVVTNGVLSDVELAPDAVTVVAGELLGVTLRGWDAYGNAYRVQTDPRVELSDATGSVSPTAVTLGADGTAVVDVALTVATPATELRASQGGTVLGVSSSIAVRGGDVAALAVEVPAWIEVGGAARALVRALDSWGNAAPDFAGSVLVTSLYGACAPEAASVFVDGVAAIEVACDSPAAGEALLADDGARTAVSTAFDVVDFACADGPVAALLLDGAETAVACTGDVVAFDATSSAAGAAALVAWHLDDGDGGGARGEAADGAVTYAEAGRRLVSVMVVDADGCADVAEAEVWVGDDDGGATGPVAVTSSATSVSTGAGVVVDVRAEDCRGAAAAGQTLAVRADLGVVGATSTGAGLNVTLDPAGAARAAWTFPTGYATEIATLVAGRADGRAGGALELQVTRDTVLPQVATVSPAGRVEAAVDAIVVRFTEPMLATSFSGATVTLTGPDDSVAVTLALSEDAKTLTVTPDAPLDPGDGVWTLTIEAAVRDASGNRLDGGYTGSVAAFEVPIGDVADATPDMTACAASLDRFAPDGDDGADDEADAVSVAVAATATPTRWAWWVADADGTRVRHGVADGAASAFSWDGRGDDGRVVASGTYTYAVAAADAVGNQSVACTGAVDVAQRVEVP